MDNNNTEILATLEPSPFRFWFGVSCLIMLTLVLIYIGLFAPDAPMLTRVLFLLFGIGAGFLTLRIVRAGRVGLVLTREELSDTEGMLVARVDEIKSADRGFVMFKPSNGFVLFVTEKRGFVWKPGLWWRVGHRVGAGGITSGPSAKFMAEAITVLIAERDGKSLI